MADNEPDITQTPGIDQIPTQPSVQKAVVVAVASLMLGLLALGFWRYGPGALGALLEDEAAAAEHLKDSKMIWLLGQWFEWSLIVGGTCVFAGLAAVLRNKATYLMLRCTLFAVYPLAAVYLVLVWLVVFSLVGAGVEFRGGPQDRATGALYWFGMTWPVMLVGVYTLWLHMMLWSRAVYAAFTGQRGSVMRGDRVLEDWRTHGKDPRARRGFYASVTTHIVILVIIPFLLQQRGCVEPYKLPKGKGDPVAMLVEMTQPKKVKKQKLTLRPNSAILTDMTELPDMTESEKEMQEKSELTYEALVKSKGGKTGGGGGKKGGWPNGTENYRIRFIRLQHSGANWADGMGKSGADLRFLREFSKLTGFKKYNKAGGESIRIAQLDDYPDDGFPPFVYITGDSIGRVSNSDRKILREYLNKGGMLFADAGSARFHRDFSDLMAGVLGKRPQPITLDHLIFQLPYEFPNGAPPFEAHGGTRAMGNFIKGRLAVFYHPGDMNDYWKSESFTAYSKQKRDMAFLLGVNIVNYSFNQCSEIIANQR